MLPELRRSCGMLPGTKLLCTSRLRQQRLLQCRSDVLCTVGSDVLCSGRLW
jgi:hypothetical protein